MVGGRRSADGSGSWGPNSAARLRRSITTTWWYTAIAIVLLEAMLALVWLSALTTAGFGAPVLWSVLLGGLVWVAATVVLLLDYRTYGDDAPIVRWRRHALPLAASAAYGLAIGLPTGLWVIGVLPLAYAITLLNWPRGVRLRVVLAVTIILVVLVVIDARGPVVAQMGFENGWWLLAFYSVVLPIMAVSSLWWWDMLVVFDRARTSEAKLAATQERLRVANDVHDLQGHHLQVIALQLELAERLLQAEQSEAAIEQLRLARGSVDDARQGTRDLAATFRGVPLSDELANAADLLRAAGNEVDLVVDPQADLAPANALGPIIRETTTNVLRHGGGRSVRLSLTRSPGAWRYETVNDTAGHVEDRDGAGLDGIRQRAREAGGTLTILRPAGEFQLVVEVPDGEALA